MLQAGIVGLPNVGKSTPFNAVTRTRKAEAANYPFCTIDPNVGVVVVPDERLAVLSKNRPEVLTNLTASLLNGCIITPLHPMGSLVDHAYCVGEDPQDWIARMAPHTVHYHLEDIAATRVHQHLIPGHGAIDFAATLAAIEATGYDGWLTVELYPYGDAPDDAARAAKEFLEEKLRTIGSPSLEGRG